MKLSVGVFFGLALLGSATVSHASQTTFRVNECGGCTAPQMEAAAATQLPGITFVYDLAANVIRKYNVDLDSTCRAPLDPQKSTSSDALTEGGAQIQCGSFKSATELTPVDSDVQATFDALRHASTVNPALVTTGVARGGAPEDPVNHVPFDLPNIAWDYPQGSYVRFNDALNAILGSALSANSFIPGLGDLLYGWHMGSFSVDLMLPPGATGSLTWDRNHTVRLEICNPDGDCWRGTITMNSGGIVSLAYEGVFDNNQQMYPSESGQAPGQLLRWKFEGPLEAGHFAGALGPNVAIPYNNCGGISFLNTARLNGKIVFQSWECGPGTP